jgi:hypothetical protein
MECGNIILLIILSVLDFGPQASQTAATPRENRNDTLTGFHAHATGVKAIKEKARIEGSLWRWNLYAGRGGQMGAGRVTGQAFYPGSPGSSPGRSI